MLSQHKFNVRVYWEDTDAGGIVYHASYIRFMERARTELIRSLGLDQITLRDELNLICVVYDMRIKFLASARFDDLLEVVTTIEHVGAARIRLQQCIQNQQTKQCVSAYVTCACMSAEGKPMRWPEVWRQRFIETYG